MKRQIVSLLLAVGAVFGIVGLMAAAESSPGEQEVVDIGQDNWLKKYRTVEEAQGSVPFEIRSPEIPPDYWFSYVKVDTVPIADAERDLVLVEVIYVSEEGGHLIYFQSNFSGVPPDSAAAYRTEIGGLDVIVDPRVSQGDDAGGSLYWQEGGLSYRVIASELNVTEMLSVAESVIRQ